MDQALFEGFVTRDPLGFYLVGPPDALEQRGYFSEHMFREFATFLIEKYDAIVIDGGQEYQRRSGDGRAARSRRRIFLVVDQEFPSIRNAQRYIALLMRMGFNQDQIKVVVNHYTKKVTAQHREPGTDPADAEPAGVLRHSAFAGGAGVDQQGAAVGGRPRRRPANWIASSARSSIRRPDAKLAAAKTA